MGQIEIVEYHKDLRGACVDLLKETFQGMSNEDTFAWRFERQCGGPPLIVCALDEDKVVSFNSWIEWKFETGAKTYRAYQSGDSATDSRYRRMGIWRRVLDLGEQIAREREVDFFYGFPSAMSYGGFYKSGYQRVGAFPFSLRFINPMLRSENGNGHSGYESVVHRGLVQKEKISPVVDSEYFHWRFTQGPRKYDIIAFSDDSNEATFVLKRNTYRNERFGLRVPEILLVDCRLSSFNKPFLDKAFKHLDRLYSRKAVWMRTFFNENTDRGKGLGGRFHLRLNRFETLIVKGMKRDLDYDLFFNSNNWDILPHVVDDY